GVDPRWNRDGGMVRAELVGVLGEAGVEKLARDPAALVPPAVAVDHRTVRRMFDERSGLEHAVGAPQGLDADIDEALLVLHRRGQGGPSGVREGLAYRADPN